MPKHQVGQHATSNNGQGVSAPQISPENPEQYWVLHWEGKKLSQVPFFRVEKQTLNDFQNLTTFAVEDIFGHSADGQLQDWPRLDITFNEYKIRGRESSIFFKTIKEILDSRFKSLSTESEPTIENLNQHINNIKEEFLQVINNQVPLENFLSKYNVTSEAKKDLTYSLAKFSNQELNSLLNSFFEKLKNEIADYRPSPSKLDNYSKDRKETNTPKPELPIINIILNKSAIITQKTVDSCLIDFFNQGIETSKITKSDKIKKSLPIFLQQPVLSIGHNILKDFIAQKTEEKYQISTADDEKFIFKTQEGTENISGELTIATYSINCAEETDETIKKPKTFATYKKRLNNQNELVDFKSEATIDKSQYKPLFITKVTPSISNGNEPKLSFLSFDIIGANNAELNSICAEVGLKPTKFADLVTQLNSINGYDGKAIVEFIHNWDTFYKFSLPKNASLRTNKETVDSKDVIETLEAIIKFHFKNNKNQQYAFCKKLQMVIADKNHTAMEKMLNNLSALSTDEKERDDYKVELFKNNLEIRKDKLRDISSILASIKKNLNIKDAYKWKDSIPQLSHDFISLGLIADKMMPRERTTFFQDLLLSDQCNREFLTAWKQSLKQIESSNQGTLDKEIFDYLNSGVEYFESLMPIANTANKDFNRDYQIKVKEGIRNLTPTNMSNDEVAEVKAKIITHHLNNQITSTPQIKGTKFNAKLNEFKNTLNIEAANEFKQGKTLKQVAHGEIGRLSDTNITLINNVTSNKSFPEKEQSCRAYQRDAFQITAKPILRTAAAVVAGAAVGFLAGAAIFTLVVAASGGIGVIPAIFASIWFGAKTAAAATAVAATFTSLGTVSGAAAGSLAANPSSFFAVKNIKNFFKFRKHTDEVANSAAVQFNPSPSPANN